ncbi:alpha/beta hydrolase [Bacillus salipaludis]|uniref:Alpha/beta hydrolase n=1 Tax=Bacillus salipaludis TaxID=2547811 RepID=A0A4R5VP66_9BACI|nr:alpha/beta hydrolase [Bacillus salipaludis]MDQ6599546.1 alpha/beta hydrolase [Bacillus salipaludis]TDK60184.1 alpha/beta hydrolase [Bacillus salipaludis]
MKKAFRTLFILLFFWLALAIYFTNRLMYMKKKDEEFILKREKEAGRYNPTQLKTLPKRKIEIPSPFGYEIKAVLVEPHQTDRYIIISHGVTETKINSIKYMNLFLERGFNVLIYDHRRHGESGGRTTSFGYYEKFDLKAVVDWLKEEKGTNLLLGIHGESMGAATMLLYAGMLEDGADFYIADCPFSDFRAQLAYLIKKDFKLFPGILLPIGDLILRIRDKYSIRNVSPISVIENIQHPVLFIHSRKDDYILPSMTQDLFEHKKGPKMLYIAEKGRHAQSFNENRTDYERVIDEFLQKYVNLEPSR